ncbi:hypothetical protein [Sphingomonas lenta]|uniref:Uncharacterized protein n=1 Tax=Sphingomonas lenta TaxID=1141887 RepID=A0A2A2SDU5_9SPHN|nr:hypothetical protein [Sphingomonas lenta]PAX07201.1 hypothetical protein CKY28_14300 [Sphingomonas lenta]
MTDPDTLARQRYYTMMAVEIAGVAGAVFGLYIIGRSVDVLPRVIGAGIVLSALLMIAVVPKSMARRWRTPPE